LHRTDIGLTTRAASLEALIWVMDRGIPTDAVLAKRQAIRRFPIWSEREGAAVETRAGAARQSQEAALDAPLNTF
jgi:hypothetical protein